jgi:hypothetical protein
LNPLSPPGSGCGRQKSPLIPRVFEFCLDKTAFWNILPDCNAALWTPDF